MSIHIAIADDHPMITDGLQHVPIVYPHIVLDAIYTTGADLMEGLSRSQPDVLLLDIQLPDTTGDRLASEIRIRFPAVRILVLTAIDSSLYIYNMFREGVSGYILKNSASAGIVKAIETVYEGGQYIEEVLKEKLERFNAKMKSRESLKPSLTAKEKEVLELTVKGYTLEEISKMIFLGRRTVEYYRSNLMLKLDARNMAELIRKTIETGMLD